MKMSKKDSKDKKEDSKKKIKEIKEEAKKDYLEDLQRVQAEFENYVKRVEKEKGNWELQSKAGLLLKIIQIKEDLEKALKNIKDEGLEMVFDQVKKILEEEGVREIEVGEFDPGLHEVVKKVKGEENKIVEEVQKGYMLGDRILRISKVIIGGKEND